MRLKFLVLSLWISLSIAAMAQDSSKVVAMENAWNQAELNNDASAVQLLLADDFIMTTADGDMYNKSQFVATIRDKSYKPLALQSTDMVVHSFGSTAIITGSYYEKGMDQGKTYERRGKFTDTWIYMQGHWQCVASQFSVKSK